MSAITPVVLCGGSGTRLWPLSRAQFPKQFVPLLGDRSLLDATLARVAGFGNGVVCVGNEAHRFLVQDALDAAGLDGTQFLEPAGRNTAAAMACAALNADADALLLFLPADHFIPDADAFVRAVEAGADAARDGYIVTFGVRPTFPSTAYGYIRGGDTLGDGALRTVCEFVEKPAADRARRMIDDGGYLWNAGIFLVRAATLVDALAAHAPDILEACRVATGAQRRDGAFVRPDRDAFLGCRSDSIDYAVLEHHDRIAVAPFDGVWSDVGSWNAVADLVPADADGNRATGRGVALGATNTYINAPHRPVVALGTRDLLIVDTADALLVADTSYAEQVKQVVADLDADGLPEAVTHRKVARPWGWYDGIERGERFQVKRIMVKPGAKLSLQLHHHRAEHWVVVSGTAFVTNGDREFVLNENESTYIPAGTKHRLENRGTAPLEIIEVQSGDYLGEDDIVRLEDTYGRTDA